jgi:hypothetical protein
MARCLKGVQESKTVYYGGMNEILFIELSEWLTQAGQSDEKIWSGI